MASVSSVSAHDAAHTAAPTDSPSTAPAGTLPPPHSAGEQQRLNRQRAHHGGHRDIDIPAAEQHAPKFQHGFHLRDQSLANLAALFNGHDDMSAIGLAQDQALANEMCRISSVTLPATMKANDGVVLPPDVMAYWVRHGEDALLRYACPEINGTGFGGIATMPPEQFGRMMNTHRDAAREMIADAHKLGEQPLLLVANSGREGARRTDGQYPASSNSKMIWEKAHIADHYARQWGNRTEDNFPDSLDKVATPYYQAIDAAAAAFGAGSEQYVAAERQAYAAASAAMAKHKDQPLVLLGYSRDIATLCRVEGGRAFLFGRPVNGLLNDRAAENLNMVQMSKLDFTKMALINSTVEEGVNKYAAALARAEFAASPEAAALPALAAGRGFVYDVKGLNKAFHYTDPAERGDVDGMSPLARKAHYATFFRGVEEHEGLAGVARAYDDFLALGDDIRPLFKPNGTGQAKGIIGVRHGESKEAFLARFEENQADLKKKFGAGAGYPFHVEMLVELDRTPDGENYDLRFTILQSRQPHVDENGRLQPRPARTMHAFPLLWKKEPAPESARGGPVEFAPTNITAAVAKTGRPANDFVQALCSAKGMREAGMEVALSQSISLYFASFYAFLLSSRYARDALPQLQIGEGKVLPFPARGASAVSALTAHGAAEPHAEPTAEQLLARFI